MRRRERITYPQGKLGLILIFSHEKVYLMGKQFFHASSRVSSRVKSYFVKICLKPRIPYPARVYYRLGTMAVQIDAKV
jgi:hypothetical protein